MAKKAGVHKAEFKHHGHKGKSMIESHGDSSMNLYTGAQISSKHGNPPHRARDQYEMAHGSKCMSHSRRLLSGKGDYDHD